MPQPTIAVLGGTGHHGRGIAQRLARAGAAVVVGSRDPARAAAAVEGWTGDVRGASYGDAIAASAVVILAVPFDSLAALLDEHASRFAPQTLVLDVSVPLAFGGGTVTLANVPEGSAAEHVKARVPPHVRVGATFKTVPAALLSEVDRPLDCDEFVCGDSAEARTDAAAIVERVQGLRAIDIGPLSRARALEYLTLVAVAINRRQKIHDARFRIVGL
jgi:NADPH-dependent F420 reductase